MSVTGAPPSLERISYLPYVDRPAIGWPGGKRLALWVVPNIEFYEYLPADNPYKDPFPRVPHPDVMQYSWRDYGNRVGLWRVADLLDRYPVKVTVSLNIAAVEHLPEVRQLIRDKSWSVMSHGVYNTAYLCGISEAAEREFYADSIETVRQELGLELKGMLGPCVTNGPITPDLMAEAGFLYHADWVHDDQPSPLAVSTGRLISLPYNYEINDGPLLESHYDGDYFVDAIIRQFDGLYSEAQGRGLVMALPLHTYLVGQPHYIDKLRRVLDHICAHEDVWFATGDEIAEAFLADSYDAFVAAARTTSGVDVRS
jgi:peptidoglycan/xylan/chitin deacetylase (PgdA/CDA1 family)